AGRSGELSRTAGAARGWHALRYSAGRAKLQTRPAEYRRACHPTVPLGSRHLLSRTDARRRGPRMAEKKRSPVADYAVYLLVRVLVCLIQILSWRMALSLARGLAWLLYRVDRRHRRVALDNLRHAFPQLDEAA